MNNIITFTPNAHVDDWRCTYCDEYCFDNPDHIHICTNIEGCNETKEIISSHKYEDGRYWGKDISFITKYTSDDLDTILTNIDHYHNDVTDIIAELDIEESGMGYTDFTCSIENANVENVDRGKNLDILPDGINEIFKAMMKVG